jgi:hypothetical protein
LECADAGRADYLIAGNQRHFSTFWKNTKIIRSSEFLSIIPVRQCCSVAPSNEPGAPFSAVAYDFAVRARGE